MRKSRITAYQIHPRTELVGEKFRCNGIPLSLARKPLASKIVAAFMKNNRRPVTREELVSIARASPRKNSCGPYQHERTRIQSINRLLSRLRLEFEETFCGVVPPGTYWFHFAERKKSWLLYKLPGEGCDGEFYE